MTHSLPPKIPILGVNIDRPSLHQLLDYLTEQIKNKNKLFLITPNPEIVLKTQKNPHFKNILNSADVAIPDGIGLLAAAKYLELTQNQKIKRPKDQKFSPLYPISSILTGLRVGFAIIFNRKFLNIIPEQISGDLLFHQLIKLANQCHWKIFLLGGLNNATEKAARKIITSYQLPVTQIHSHSGASDITHETTTDHQEIIQTINQFRPHLLFVAYGAPWQETWIHDNFSKLKVNLAMGIGGTLDDFAGLNPPTPLTFRNLGLRWLWRLTIQPKRFKRIWNAVVVFPWTIWEKSN